MERGRDGDPLCRWGGPHFPWLTDPLLEEPTFSSQAYFDNKKWLLSLVCRTDATAVYEPVFDVLLQAKRACGKTPLLVVLIPDEMQVEDAQWDALFAGSSDLERLDRSQPQRLLGGWLEERSIPYLDLLPPFRRVPPLADGDRHLYHLRNTHFNRRGNEVAGRALAEFLRSRVK